MLHIVSHVAIVERGGGVTGLQISATKELHQHKQNAKAVHITNESRFSVSRPQERPISTAMTP